MSLQPPEKTLSNELAGQNGDDSQSLVDGDTSFCNGKQTFRPIL